MSEKQKQSGEEEWRKHLSVASIFLLLLIDSERLSIEFREAALLKNLEEKMKDVSRLGDAIDFAEREGLLGDVLNPHLISQVGRDKIEQKQKRSLTRIRYRDRRE